MCHERSPQDTGAQDMIGASKQSPTLSNGPILVATPSTDDKKINIYQLPDEKLKYVVPKASTSDTGE
jgi:hypothetical protein